eukprot:1139475-Pelagomonas_calceolata.AAC.2
MNCSFLSRAPFRVAQSFTVHLPTLVSCSRTGCAGPCSPSSANNSETNMANRENVIFSIALVLLYPFSSTDRNTRSSRTVCYVHLRNSVLLAPTDRFTSVGIFLICSIAGDDAAAAAAAAADDDDDDDSNVRACRQMRWGSWVKVMGGRRDKAYALGFIYANHGHDIHPFLLESLRGSSDEITQHGACLGLGAYAWM